MKVRRWMAFALALLLVVALIGAPVAGAVPATRAAAQASSALVMLKDGDLWRWDGSTLTRLSTWGYNERPVLAPDGLRVAYNSWAQITANAIVAGQPVQGLIPSNIWVLEIATGNGQRLADQPADASFMQTGVPDRAIMRSTPEWSPDGGQLAWVELLVPEYRFQLVVYDFATATARAIVNSLPFPFADAGYFPMHELLWGARGLLVRYSGINPSTAEFEDYAALYAPQDGALIHQQVIGSSASEYPFNVQWVQYLGQQRLGLHYPSGKITMIDPATGDQQEMPAVPERYSKAAPQGIALMLAPSSDAQQNLIATWTAIDAARTQPRLLNFTGQPHRIALAADGQRLAYISDALYIWQNGQATQVPGTDGIASTWDVAIVWAPDAWRVPDQPVALATGMGGGPVMCGPAPRLTLGGTGQVTPGLPNALRSQPRRGADSAILGQIPGGGLFDVLGGPQCDAEGRYWWQVNYQGVIGWTPEGEGVTYWLQPYSATPPPVACTLAPRLTVGSTAYVLPGLPNLLRAQPRRGADSAVIGRIPGSGVFTVLSGPVCDNQGRYWWQVSYQGLTGWTAEGEGQTYWVAPFGCPASPRPRLAPGMQARVTPGLPNRLRSGPGSSYSEIGTIPAGGVLTVLSGPQCGPEGWSYWRVQAGYQVGWTAEGQGTTYWLEPVTATPPTPPTPVACTMTPRLTVGGSGRVLPGLPNILRSQPRRGADSAILGQVPGGEIFSVVSGPQCDGEGRYWWQVSFQGVTGWTPEGEGGVYWLEPLASGPATGCGPAPRLTVGASAFVTPGPANVLRSEAGSGGTSAVIGQIPGGAFFYVLSGPWCAADGRNWWLVNYQGVTGWTAEGEGATYWLSPFLCGSGMPTRLIPAGYARVTPGDPNTLRAAPGTSSAALGQIPGGATISVLSGPQCGPEGWVWWQVAYQGMTGWTAEGQGGVYWLEPLMQ